MAGMNNLSSGGNMLIGAKEATRGIKEEEKPFVSYRAVLKKKIGRITEGEFLEYSRRLMFFYTRAYQENKLELRKGKDFSLGLEARIFGDPCDRTAGNPGVMIDVNRPTVEQLRDMLNGPSSMTLRIIPVVSSGDIRHSFARVEWKRDRPRTISFFAQHGCRDDPESGPHPLERFLLQEMFHVSGVVAPIPSPEFTIELGLDAVIEEEGWKL